VAAWVLEKFCYFYVVKSPKIGNNSATTDAREKITTDSKSVLVLYFYFMYV
jgi:hypothetical protein